jgi:uncharacterized protein (TIGR02145 family)
MKKLFTLLAVIAAIAAFAQAPQGFNYQATVRNASGALVTNQNVYFKFNLMLNSATSVPVFSETHYVPTDDLGQVNLVIGTGTATTGTFSTINWGTGNYYLGIELNTGSGYVAMGTTQLLSVPYALYANSAGSSTGSNSGMVLPIVTTNPATDISSFGATFSASVSNANINQLSKRAGFVCSTSPNPILDFTDQNNELQIVLNSNTFTYVTTFDYGLFLPNTLNYVRAYVITENNTIVYGNEITFTTIPSMYQYGNGVTDVDGNLYPSNIINNQEWTQKNLVTTKYSDGTPIPQVTDQTAWASLTTGAWCYVNNDPTKDVYGKLYNWYAVAGIYDVASLNDPTLRKKLAPTGWHVPSEPEWMTLINILGGETVAGGKMKSVGTLIWGSPNTGATNESGFNAIPSGERVGDEFATFGGRGSWWSSSEDVSVPFYYFYHMVYRNATLIFKSSTAGYVGYSVRCIKN